MGSLLGLDELLLGLLLLWGVVVQLLLWLARLKRRLLLACIFVCVPELDVC